MTCNHCGRNFSPTDIACPSCGSGTGADTILLPDDSLAPAPTKVKPDKVYKAPLPALDDAKKG